MTDTSSSLFDVTLELEDGGFGNHPDPHKVLYLVPPANESDHSSALQLTAARWRVGLVSRVVLRLWTEMTEAQTALRHGCARQYGRPESNGYHCGFITAHNMTAQTAWDPGFAGIAVPDTEAEQWAARARARIREAITTDLVPPAPDTDHRQVVLTEPASEGINA